MADDPFENMLAQMDRAEEYADVDHGVFERLKHPERTLKVTLPVELESGEVEVFEGYRCQFDSARELQRRYRNSAWATVSVRTTPPTATGAHRGRYSKYAPPTKGAVTSADSSTARRTHTTWTRGWSVCAVIDGPPSRVRVSCPRLVPPDV